MKVTVYKQVKLEGVDPFGWGARLTHHRCVSFLLLL